MKEILQLSYVKLDNKKEGGKFQESSSKQHVYFERICILVSYKQDQKWPKAASQDQLTTKLNYFKSNQFLIQIKRFQIQVISNPSVFKSK